EVYFVGETAAMFLIGEEIDGQWQPTPRRHRHEALMTKSVHQAIEGHRREVIEHCTQLQTEAAMRRPHGVTGHLRMHLTVAQEEVGEDREDVFALRTLNTPDREATQADTGVMRVACQAPTATTGRLMCELKAKSQEKGEHAFDKRLPIAQELKVGRFIVEIDGDGAVFTGLADSVAHGHPQVR